MEGHRVTLSRFLAAEAHDDGDAGGALRALILNVAAACGQIADKIRDGAPGSVTGSTAAKNSPGETQQSFDLIANDIFLKIDAAAGGVAAMISKEMEAPVLPAPGSLGGKYLLAFDPLDGPSNFDVNVAVGSIFSILRAATPRSDGAAAEFLQPGSRQICAGYAIYGPSTMLVLTLGRGVHGFTLDPKRGDFFLTHPTLSIPATTAEFAINASNSRFWEPAVRRYIDECLAGTAGARGKDFDMRWVASLVAAIHRILIRGGVFLYPRDRKDPAKPGRLRLLYEANPISFIVEQAGGRSISGSERILDIAPSAPHQRIGLIFGAREEVDRIEAYYRDQDVRSEDTPLFAHRGLFRTSA